FHPLDRVEEVEAALEITDLPAVIKTRRLGYDGKGQAVVANLEEARACVERLGPGLVAEEFVPFDRELSLIAVAGLDGEHRFYPLTENHHEGGILRVSYGPAQHVPESVRAQAEAYGRALIERLGYVGVLAIEFFLHGDRLLANEMAPRVHNSGHWTQDGAQVSQFENHIRAVLGLPLGETGATGHSVMLNLIGRVPALAELLRVPQAHVHLYGKAPRPGRKLGHVNVTGHDRGVVLDSAARIAALAGFSGPLPGPGGRS
ncbi:MAG: ATP-grasp domain-containing protein, partial [Gemmatimonadetes bacterium]|nr:ATP-grasp domain-containing protein [Gemmatimonadota bacterium]